MMYSIYICMENLAISEQHNCLQHYAATCLVSHLHYTAAPIYAASSIMKYAQILNLQVKNSLVCKFQVITAQAA